MDEDLINLTRNIRAAAAEGEKKKKRGRGRPRKERLPSPPPEEEEETDPDDEGLWGGAGSEGMGAYEEGESYVVGGGGGAENKKSDFSEKVELINMITELREKLNAKGTGMRPHVTCSLTELREEFEVLNREIDARRAGTLVKHIALEVVIPLVEAAVPYFVSQEQMDVTGMTQEAKDNYDEVFKDTLTHISILNRKYFAVGPYGEFINGVMKMGAKAALKNKLRKELKAKAEATNAVKLSDSNDEDIEDK